MLGLDGAVLRAGWEVVRGTRTQAASSASRPEPGHRGGFRLVNNWLWPPAGQPVAGMEVWLKTEEPGALRANPARTVGLVSTGNWSQLSGPAQTDRMVLWPTEMLQQPETGTARLTQAAQRPGQVVVA